MNWVLPSGFSGDVSVVAPRPCRNRELSLGPFCVTLMLVATQRIRDAHFDSCETREITIATNCWLACRTTLIKAATTAPKKIQTGKCCIQGNFI
jgi:hypothetical protein